MYLSVKESDKLDALVKSFEVIFRSYISNTILISMDTEQKFLDEINALLLKTGQSSIILSGKMESLLKRIKSNYHQFYSNLKYSNDCYINQKELDIPHDVSYVSDIIGLSYLFASSYLCNLLLFKTKEEYLFLSSIFYNVRNALSHRGSELITNEDMFSTVYFISEISSYINNINENYFWYRSKNDIDYMINDMLKSENELPIHIHNINEIPFSDRKFVCRETELENLQDLTYSRKEYTKKPTSICIYGYGGVGKTAIIHEFIKILIKDIKDGKLTKDYYDFLLFFTAKDNKLTFDKSTGEIEVKPLITQFNNCSELQQAICNKMGVSSVGEIDKRGIIIIDNLESITPDEERERILKFIKFQSPYNIQYIVTSRPPEKLDEQILIEGFDETEAYVFIEQYINENELKVELTESEQCKLIELSQGNALVLVLSLNRLDTNIVTFGAIAEEFRSSSFSAIEHELAEVPAMAFNVISDFMYRNTIQEIERIYSSKKELIYTIFKSLAVYEEALDEYTLCLLTKRKLGEIKDIMNILCKYMVVEKKSDKYIINEFANKYILEKFVPNNVEKNKLYLEIKEKVKNIKRELEDLDKKAAESSELRSILKDWQADTYGDKIAISKAYSIFNDVKYCLKYELSVFRDDALEQHLERFKEISNVTIHPYVEIQKATTLNLIEKETNCKKYKLAIKNSYEKCISHIRWYYPHIKITKSFAIVLWKYGQFLLTSLDDVPNASKYLEEATEVFRKVNQKDDYYFQCLSRLGHTYVLLAEQNNDKTYRNEAEKVLQELIKNEHKVPKKYRYFISKLEDEIACTTI